MAAVRRFCCLELETVSLAVGCVSFLLSLAVLIIIASDESYASPVLNFISFCYWIIHLLASGSLVFGIRKREQYFLLPWLIIHSTAWILLTLYICKRVFEFAEVVAKDYEFGINYYSIVIFFTAYALWIYMILGVAQLYSKLNDKNQQNSVMNVHHASPPPCASAPPYYLEINSNDPQTTEYVVLEHNKTFQL